MADATGQSGTGLFSASIAIDDYDSNHFAFPVDYSLMTIISNGVLSQPQFYNPATMWDGTFASAGILLTVDSTIGFSVIPSLRVCFCSEPDS